MKLYVMPDISGSKTYLKVKARNRKELRRIIGAERIRVDGRIYPLTRVMAEPSENTAGAMALGGVIGIAGGVPGVILGGIVGGLLGKSSDDEEKVKVEEFNQSLGV